MTGRKKLQSTGGGLAYDKAPPHGRKACSTFSQLPRQIQGQVLDLGPCTAHVLSRREFYRRMKSSSAVKILTDLATSMNSTFSKQDEQGDFSCIQVFYNPPQVPCWMRLDTKGSLKESLWVVLELEKLCFVLHTTAHLVRVL